MSRTAWFACVLVAAAFAASCGSRTPVPESLEVDETSDALTQEQFECERTKRECLVKADCDADAREACETAFRACEEPVRAEKKQVREMCRTEREKCAAAATDEAGRHACHMAEHKCKLPVEPPEAVCHIEAEECIWAARDMSPAPTMPPTKSAAEEACREQERECKESLRLHPEDLPKPPKCPPGPPPPACTPDDDAGVADDAPEAPVPESLDDLTCERTKRECLIAADCDADKREACKSAFHACEEPVRAEKKLVHEMCRTARETCEAAATDEAGRHACHIAEHKCKLPVEPPDAVCRIEEEECVWAARGMGEMKAAPAPMSPPMKSAAEEACREKKRECVEAKRMRPEELPKPPHCPPRPPACKPEKPAP